MVDLAGVPVTTFAGYLVSLIVGPMANRWGAAYARALGGSLDGAADAILEAGRVAGPGDAQDDALARLGWSRAIAQGQGEGLTSYRRRLVGAWDSWSWAGTRYGIAQAVSLLGFGTPAVVSWHAMPWDSDETRWPRLTVIFSGRVDAGVARAGHDRAGGRVVQPIEALDPDAYEELLRATLRQWINARDRVSRVIVARGGARAGRAIAGIDRAASLAVTILTGYRAGRSSTRSGRAVAGAFC